MKNYIRECRNKAGMNQRELSEKLSLKSTGTVSMWERGSRSPNAEMLLNISSVLHCTVDELLRGPVEAATDTEANRQAV